VYADRSIPLRVHGAVHYICTSCSVNCEQYCTMLGNSAVVQIDGIATEIAYTDTSLSLPLASY
jgi:hypothetical protein